MEGARVLLVSFACFLESICSFTIRSFVLSEKYPGIR